MRAGCETGAGNFCHPDMKEMHHQKNARVTKKHWATDISRSYHGFYVLANLMVLDNSGGKHCMKLAGGCTTSRGICQGSSPDVPELYPIHQHVFGCCVLVGAAKIGVSGAEIHLIRVVYLAIATNAQEAIVPLLSAAQIPS